MESDLRSVLGIFINGQNIKKKNVGTVAIEKAHNIIRYLHGSKDQHSRKGMTSSCPEKKMRGSQYCSMQDTFQKVSSERSRIVLHRDKWK